LGNKVSTTPKQYPWLPQRHFLFNDDPQSEVPERVEATASPAAVHDFVEAHRQYGHRCATLDPLETAHMADRQWLRPQRFGLFPQYTLEAHDAERLGVSTVQALDQRLKALYCGALALDCSGMRDSSRAAWLYERMESAESPVGSLGLPLLDRLIRAQSWERLLGQTYPHGKRFSLEGCEALIPLIDQLIERAAHHGVQHVAMGMPHRGRVNVLVNVMGMAATEAMDFFEKDPRFLDLHRDLIYHLGAARTVKTADGAVGVRLAYNPSHLQSVYPVVCGMAHGLSQHTGEQVLPIVMHGDAAFAGQGVVMETLTMTQRPGYSVGGTVHVIINNQVGFTEANPMSGEQPRFCTDITRMIDAPVLRVSADAPEEVVRAAAIALDYRMHFGSDVVIDLIGYRRLGHSEHDVPALTRPQLAALAEDKTTVVEVYAQALVDKGIAPAQNVLDHVASLRTAVVDAWQNEGRTAPERFQDAPKVPSVAPVSLPMVRHWLGAMTTLPEGFRLHADVEALRTQWLQAAENPASTVGWSLAENLAYASLLSAGVSVRISGMDVQRGTFMHRHVHWHDQAALRHMVPLQQIGATGRFDAINSSLAEEAVLGYEYGRSVQDVNTLNLWEAQFGDFVNEGQVYLDQYISSGEAKWGTHSALGVLLPHGYEGNGPEHSTGYLGRFLQLCGDENLRVVMPSTSGQWFHLLRRQALDPVRKPMIVMSPKGTLYNEPGSHTCMQQLLESDFQPVLSDASSGDKAAVTRIVLCSGKLHYDLERARVEFGAKNVALLRLEQLYPFPASELASELSAYPSARELVWAQEEHLNQGAWAGVRDDLAIAAARRNLTLRCASRVVNAAGATTAVQIHRREQRELVEQIIRGEFAQA
jgi:2-oxoglutarate dehydrogenase E1 component